MVPGLQYCRGIVLWRSDAVCSTESGYAATGDDSRDESSLRLPEETLGTYAVRGTEMAYGVLRRHRV